MRGYLLAILPVLATGPFADRPPDPTAPVAATVKVPVPSRAGPATPDTALESELRSLIDVFSGRAGIYARRLQTGQEVAIHAEEVFPTASMIKIPLLVGLYAAMEEGGFQLWDELPYEDSFATPGGGDVLNKLRPGENVTLWRLAGLMIMLGDHVAAGLIQQLVGGASVNAWLAGHGFEQTRVNSRVPGREAAYEAYGWGQSTPRELSRLLVMIREGEAISESASSDMFRLLSRNWWPLGAKSAIPPTVNVAAKAGGTSTTRSEILLVNAPGGDYVLCVMAREDSEGVFEGGDELIRAVSAAVWERWGDVGT